MACPEVVIARKTAKVAERGSLLFVRGTTTHYKADENKQGGGTGSDGASREDAGRQANEVVERAKKGDTIAQMVIIETTAIMREGYQQMYHPPRRTQD